MADRPVTGRDLVVTAVIISVVIAGILAESLAPREWRRILGVVPLALMWLAGVVLLRRARRQREREQGIQPPHGSPTDPIEPA